MSDLFRTILLFGAPGSGKGTQGKILGQIPGFFHLSCGDVFRALQPESDLGRMFLEYSSRGQLVPDDLTVKLWQVHASRLVDAGHFSPDGEILVLDGIPRNVAQAELMQSYIDVKQLVYLETHDQEKMVARLNRRALLHKPASNRASSPDDLLSTDRSPAPRHLCPVDHRPSQQPAIRPVRSATWP